MTNTVIFFPLDLFRGLNDAFGYIVLTFGIGLTIWLMGD